MDIEKKKNKRGKRNQIFRIYHENKWRVEGSYKRENEEGNRLARLHMGNT